MAVCYVHFNEAPLEAELGSYKGANLYLGASQQSTETPYPAPLCKIYCCIAPVSLNWIIYNSATAGELFYQFLRNSTVQNKLIRMLVKVRWFCPDGLPSEIAGWMSLWQPGWEWAGVVHGENGRDVFCLQPRVRPLQALDRRFPWPRGGMGCTGLTQNGLNSPSLRWIFNLFNHKM